MIIGPDGRRFANEAAPYQLFVNIMHERRIGAAWFIGDHRMLRYYGMGFALPAPLPYRGLVKDGYLREAPTIAALAERIGVDVRVLEDTVARFNEYAAKGEDPDFDRGGNIYDNALGDYELPSPNLGPLVKPPSTLSRCIPVT